MAADNHPRLLNRVWYAPLTLVAYWMFSLLCVVAAIAAAATGEISHMRRLLRLVADANGSLRFQESPLTFILIVLGFIGGAVVLFVFGLVKFRKRRREYVRQTL